MQRHADTVLQPDGKPLAGASVLVTLTGTSTPTTLFANATGSLPLSNPTATDASGLFAFYAADGRYDLTITRSGFSEVLVPDVLLEDPAETSAAVLSSIAVRETGGAATMGLATLVAGLATVATTAIGVSTRVLLTPQAVVGTQGMLRVDSRSAGASFVIASSSVADASQVAWLLLEPAP